MFVLVLQNQSPASVLTSSPSLSLTFVLSRYIIQHTESSYVSMTASFTVFFFTHPFCFSRVSFNNYDLFPRMISLSYCLPSFLSLFFSVNLSWFFLRKKKKDARPSVCGYKLKRCIKLKHWSGKVWIFLSYMCARKKSHCISCCWSYISIQRQSETESLKERFYRHSIEM